MWVNCPSPAHILSTNAKAVWTRKCLGKILFRLHEAPRNTCWKDLVTLQRVFIMENLSYETTSFPGSYRTLVRVRKMRDPGNEVAYETELDLHENEPVSGINLIFTWMEMPISREKQRARSSIAWPESDETHAIFPTWKKIFVFSQYSLRNDLPSGKRETVLLRLQQPIKEKLYQRLKCQEQHVIFTPRWFRTMGAVASDIPLGRSCVLTEVLYIFWSSSSLQPGLHCTNEQPCTTSPY